VISQWAVVESTELGENVEVAEFAIIRRGVGIGNNVIIHPHVVIESGVTIGDSVEIFPGAYIGKEPKSAGALAHEPSFRRYVTIGAHSSIGPNAVIYYDVEIGDHSLIGEGASIREQGRIGSRCVVSRNVTLNYNVVVGDRTKIMDLTHVTGNCRIANDVFISANVVMTNDNALGEEGYQDHVVGPTIEEGAMIGAGANLLPGIVIGCRAIVGAGAVVTRDVEAWCVVMGIPARVVRRREVKA